MLEKLNFTINGENMELMVDPSIMLLDLLREQLLLTGTKKGCGKGECGACTIIMNGKSVNSCIIPVMKAQGAILETVEGLNKGLPEGQLHPLQEAFISEGAVQCGFCIPGMLMSAKALLDENKDPSADDIKYAIGGNICRCTGYKKIESGIMNAAQKLKEGE